MIFHTYRIDLQVAVSELFVRVIENLPAHLEKLSAFMYLYPLESPQDPVKELFFCLHGGQHAVNIQHHGLALFIGVGHYGVDDDMLTLMPAVVDLELPSRLVLDMQRKPLKFARR